MEMHHISRFFSLSLLGITFSFFFPPRPAFCAEYADPFIPIDLGIGGDQHYTNATRRYFTNIADVAVGDLDGDGLDDIVVVANAIPENGAYFSAGPHNNYFGHYYSGERWDNFLSPGDALWGVGDALAADFNRETTNLSWFLTSPLNTSDDSTIAHFAPPSPNVVAGMAAVPPYVGSDVGWLRGDGRGHFELRFVTPLDSTNSPRPVRIRMANGVRLANMRGSGTGLDIVLMSGTDLNASEYYPDTKTTIEPLTGTGRIFWLENKGWEGGTPGSRLNFIDHGIAEYNYDRLPVIFYNTANTGKWMGHGASLKSNSLDLFDITDDGRLDVCVNNLTNGGANYSVGTEIYSSSLDATLNSNYSPAILNHARPKDGDRWTTRDGTPDSPKRATLLCYKNETNGALAHISTSTYFPATNPSPPGVFDTPISGQVARMRIGSSAFVFVDIVPSLSSGHIVCYRRTGTPMDLKLTGTQFPDVSSLTENTAFAVAPLDGDSYDELIINQESSNIDRIKIYKVSPSGSNNVTISELYNNIMSNVIVGDIKVADLNNDGRRDIIIASKGETDFVTDDEDAATLLINTNTSPLAFKAVRQKTPRSKDKNKMKNDFNHANWNKPGPNVRISTGNFNNDGFVDFVRVGPNIPMTLFINNINGMQRVRVRAVATHGKGTSAEKRKVWNATLGGELIPGSTTVRVSSTPAGGLNVQSGTSE